MNWPLVRQTWIASGLFINFLGQGMVLSYSSGLQRGLMALVSTMDPESTSWLDPVEGIVLSMMVGFVITTVAMERFGRRWVFAGGTVIELLSWQIIYWASTVNSLILGRLQGGLACGILYGSGCCYIAEFASPEYRGLFLNIKTITLSLGYFVMQVLDEIFYWRTLALISMVPFVISLLINFAWPESPSWLLKKNRFEECEEVFYWLRGRSDKAVKELEAMVQAQKLRLSPPLRVSWYQRCVNFLNKCRQPNFLKPVSIVVSCCFCMEFEGKQFLAAYAFDILKYNETSEDAFHEAISFYFDIHWNYMISVVVISIICAGFACVLDLLMGRKTLLFFSGITATILLLTISLLTLVISIGSISELSPWFVPYLVYIYFLFSNLGASVIPFVISAEIFPLSHREVGSGLSGFIYLSWYLIYSKILPYSLDYLNLYGTCAVSALCMIVSLVYLYFALPETRNRTLQEIEDYFEHGRFLDTERRVDVGTDATISFDKGEFGIHQNITHVYTI